MGRACNGRSIAAPTPSEVSLDHVGLILGVEMSRPARSRRDWHQWLERCGVLRTLIAELDGVDTPARSDDQIGRAHV